MVRVRCREVEGRLPARLRLIRAGHGGEADGLVDTDACVGEQKLLSACFAPVDACNVESRSADVILLMQERTRLSNH